MKNRSIHELFRQFAVNVSELVGSPWAFLSAIGLILVTGYYYKFSPEWKGNTSFFATLSALLLLFFLQKSQNHSDKATHLKLDELIKAVEGARNEVVSAETQTEMDIEDLKRHHRESPEDDQDRA